MHRCGRSSSRSNAPSQPKEKSLSPFRLCSCRRVLSHRRHQSLPPNNTLCFSCVNSRRLEELERWEDILEEEIERRTKEMDLMEEKVNAEINKMNIEFRLDEINRIITGDFLEVLLEKKALVDPAKARKGKALLQNAVVEQLYEFEKEEKTRELEELRRKKEKIERDLKKIPKQSKFFREIVLTKKKKKSPLVDSPKI
ncbi:uncharacterized protein LOC129284748 isoform X2 [Prosopis cineraria]|nr:uncharacterized protein LOC129284748 isoform X2 [Prosopis cineraria]